MTITRLATRRVEKPWGRRTLWPGFEDVLDGGEPVGEIWFEAPGDPELLVKYLFTDEKLSVQVHPDDARAHALGQPRGKSEAWLVLDAEPDAAMGLGLTQPMAPAALRAAALDGSVEQALDWRRVQAGDFFPLPAGTIHALGAGITLIEVQQNSDTTYRLYDYGRPRELHVEQAVEAADIGPYPPAPAPKRIDQGRAILLEGPAFVVERWAGARQAMLAATRERPVWFISISGSSALSGRPIDPGTVWLADESAKVELAADADLLVAYPGSSVLPVE